MWWSATCPLPLALGFQHMVKGLGTDTVFLELEQHEDNVFHEGSSVIMYR